MAGALVAGVLLAGVLGPSVVVDAAPSGVATPAGQGSDLDAAAAKAAGDVTVLEGQLEQAKAADAAARTAAAEQEAELAKRRDTAATNAETEKQKMAALDTELLALDQQLKDLAQQLKDAEALLASHLANLRSWAAISFVNDGKGQFASVIDPTDLEPRRKTELSKAGAMSLKDRVSETQELIKQIQASIEATKARVDAAKVERQNAEEAKRDFEVEASVAEEERTLAVEAEFARQQSAELAQYELALKITQAQAMATKFTQMRLDESTLIAQPPVLDATDLARWFKSTGKTARLTVTIDELTAFFIAEGQAEGIRMDVAFAQSILETGYFSFPSFGQLKPEDNNYAGIGACDACANGFGFPDSQTGVRAQAQLLRVYSTPTLTINDFANPSVRWNPEKLGIRGCCSTFRQLAGVWATNTDYYSQINAVWSGIVNWLAKDYLANGPAGISAGGDPAGVSGPSGADGALDPLGGGGD